MCGLKRRFSPKLYQFSLVIQALSLLPFKLAELNPYLCRTILNSDQQHVASKLIYLPWVTHNEGAASFLNLVLEKGRRCDLVVRGAGPCNLEAPGSRPAPRPRLVNNQVVFLPPVGTFNKMLCSICISVVYSVSNYRYRC